MVAAKPDCTGQRFGMLVVVGRGNLKYRTVNSLSQSRTWRLLCDCGNEIELVRGDFDRVKNGQKSCGCLGRNRKNMVDNKRRPVDKTGHRFGALVVIEMLPYIRENNASVWRCQCDCGNLVNFNAKRLHIGYRLNCGDKQHLPGSWYPPTPSPFPEAAGEIVVKYLSAVNAKYRTENINVEIEDERMERLIRAAWIITYRREQGENLSELFERRYIYKYLRFAWEAIKARKARATLPNIRYAFRDDLKNDIGIGMTNAIFPRVAENILEPDNILRGNKPKRFKFKTC
jgi:hypothetical protein